MQLPMSLKYAKHTFVLLYGTEEGVLMVIRLGHEYADELAKDHPEICRAHFPAGSDWYYLPIDGAFLSKPAVYEVIDYSMDSIKKRYEKHPKKPKAPAPPANQQAT
jgi:hypothetical protein